MSFIPQFTPSLTTSNEQIVSQPELFTSATPMFGSTIFHDFSGSSGPSGSIALYSSSIVHGRQRIIMSLEKDGQGYLETKERVICGAGQSVEAGWGIQAAIGDNYSSLSSAYWGLFSASDGFFFQWRDPNGAFDGGPLNGFAIVYRSGSAQSAPIYQSSWNVDSLDGNGPSGKTLNMGRGVFSTITYSNEGFGTVEFSFMDPSPGSNVAKPIVAHRLNLLSLGHKPIFNFCLPLRIETSNFSGTDAPMATSGVDVLTRYIRVRGKQQNARSRTVACEFSSSSGVLAGDSLVDIALVGFDSNDSLRAHPPIFLNSIEIAADHQVAFQVLKGYAQVNGSYSIPSGWPSEECFTRVLVPLGGSQAVTGSILNPYEPLMKIDAGFAGYTGQAMVHRDFSQRPNTRMGTFDKSQNSEVILIRARRLTTSTTTVYATIIMKEMW